MGNLKRSFACKSTQNNNIQSGRDDALHQSKVDRYQVQVVNKNTNKKLVNSKKIVQDAKYAVHGARDREEATKKIAEADVSADHARELKTDPSCHSKIY